MHILQRFTIKKMIYQKNGPIEDIWLIDWIMFNTVLAIFQPYKDGLTYDDISMNKKNR